MTGIIDTLRERGLVQDITDEALAEKCRKERITVYIGFDPTASSLHIGHLVSILVLRHFQLAGHTPLAVVGGGTGMIGDPSGRSAERNLLTREELEENVEALRATLKRFLDFDGENAAVLLNNADWLAEYRFLDFLRDVGKYFRLGDMLGKESVRRRMESESGLSYTEFSYQLLQAYDFRYLYEHHNCIAQAGGSDQWGNITAGTDYIRRTVGGDAYGMTTPLLTNAQGEKMGKTAEGAVWLDSERFSPYKFYQFWMQQEDRDVDRFLRMLTFMPLEEVSAAVREHEANPSERLGQRRLAREMTALVHGEAEAAKAEEASMALFGRNLQKMSDEQLRSIFPDVPSVRISRNELQAGLPVLDLLLQSNLVPSKKEAKRLLSQGGVYLNNSADPWPGDRRTVGPDDLLSESMLVLRAGKKKYCLVEFTP